MANKRVNKQIRPKGDKMGGRAKKMGGGMMMRPMYKEGRLVKEDPMRDRKKQPLRTKSGGKKTNPFDPNKDPKKRLGRKMGGSLKAVQPNQQG